MTKYLYGMKGRPVSLGCQPKDYEHVVEFTIKVRYFDIIAYSRQLTDQEVYNYELEYLGVVEK